MRKIWKSERRSKSLLNFEESIVGILTPVKWDRFGNVLEFSVYTDEEEDFLVVGFKNKRKLESLVSKPVQATGIIENLEDGCKTIRLKKIVELIGSGTPNLEFEKAGNIWSDEYEAHFPEEYAFI